jgi:argininosuccinate lyase
VVIGNLVQVFALLKGLPSTYNSDMQEDKKILFSVKNDCLQSVGIFSKVLASAEFNGEKISASLDTGFTEATDAADYLVKKGESFRKSHNIIGKIVRHCIENNLGLKDLQIDVLKKYSEYFEIDFYDAIEIKSCISSKSTDCGTSLESVKNNIRKSKKAITVFEKQVQNLGSRIPDFSEIIKNYL